MRLLLDECLPQRLRHELPGHEVATVQRLGWAGTKNGALLRRVAEEGFDAFITIDKGIEFQQRIVGLSFGVIALCALTNDIVQLRPLMPEVLAMLPQLGPGQLIRVPR